MREAGSWGVEEAASAIAAARATVAGERRGAILRRPPAWPILPDDPMSTKRACLQHIYNTGVNLAWAQVHTQTGQAAGTIRASLVRARDHARAAGFLDGAAVDLAIGRLDAAGVGPAARDAIEAALFNLQGQLRDYCCDVDC